MFRRALDEYPIGLNCSHLSCIMNSDFNHYCAVVGGYWTLGEGGGIYVTIFFFSVYLKSVILSEILTFSKLSIGLILKGIS